MKELLKPILMTAVGVIVGLIVYDMFVKGMVGNNFESDNYEVDAAGNVMKAA